MAGQYSFGRRSLDQLAACHWSLAKIHEVAIQRTPIDYGISESLRSMERAREMFELGRSTLNPDALQFSKHIGRDPEDLNIIKEDGVAIATDIYIWHNNPETRKRLQYDVPSLSVIYGVIYAVARELYQAGTIPYMIRWGGNWNNNGIILIDQNFDDLPHFELIV